MFSLTRCQKQATLDGAECIRFRNLPDDIVILIFSECTVDEVLALRSTDRRSRNLIAEYINTIAPSVAQATFPRSRNLLLHKPLRYNIQWLESLIPQQLAAILVDRHRIAYGSTQQRYGIPAEDPYGDKLRARIANGWHVLLQLARISKQTLRDSSERGVGLNIRLPCFSLKTERARQTDDIIHERRLAYIESMPKQDAKDYKLMFMLLSSSFRTSISNIGSDHKPWVFDWGSGIDGQRLFRKGSSWLTWFVLAEGPTLFWKQWWTLPYDSIGTKHYIRDRAIKMWSNTPRKLIDLQREHARGIQEVINIRADVSADFVSVNPIPYFTKYAECRLSRWKSGILPAEETMTHVPFHIEFRCPEELVQQHRLLLQGKEAAKTYHTTARD